MHAGGWLDRLSGAKEAADQHEDARTNPYYLVFAAVWLVYLVDPIAAAWRVRETTSGLIGLLSTVTFAVAYLWHFARSRRYAWNDADLRGGSDPLPRILRHAVLAALALVTTVTVGQAGTATWVFLAVAGLWTFPATVAVGLAAVLAVAYEVVVHNVTGWERDNGISLSIVLAVLAVGGGMLASRRSRDLGAARRENARLAVQDERNRMARDLHDILGHSLTVITVKAELAGRLIDVAPERAKVEIESLEGLAREALADVRSAVEGFREISLSGELARAREALASAGIEARLPRTVEGAPADLRELYAWVIREGVTNVIRHSSATRCTISLDERALTITDNGSSASAAADDSGNGLRGLRERAAQFGAVLETSRLDRGFEIAVLVPTVDSLSNPRPAPAREPRSARPATAGGR